MPHAVVSATATGLVAAIHSYIFYLEAFLWTSPRGRRTFRTTPEFAAQTATLAANQGLYNGFLAAGLAWGVAHPDARFAAQLRLFFLGCVGVAGVVGRATTGNGRILWVQTVPAVGAAALVLAGL